MTHNKDDSDLKILSIWFNTNNHQQINVATSHHNSPTTNDSIRNTSTANNKDKDEYNYNSNSNDESDVILHNQIEIILINYNSLIS